MQKGQTLIFLLIGVLVLAGVAGGVYYLGTRKSSTLQDTVSRQNPIVIPSTSPQANNKPTSDTTPQNDETANWKTYISPCDLSIKYPQGWNAQKYFIVDSIGSCVFITAPDYKQGGDSRSGFSITIKRLAKGSVNMNIILNTVDDYIKSVEAVLQPPTPVTNKMTKTYGSLTGTQFDFGALESITNFIVSQGDYFYTIEWPTELQYNGHYRKNIDQIISTFKFL